MCENLVKDNGAKEFLWKDVSGLILWEVLQRIYVSVYSRMQSEQWNKIR